MIRQILYRLGVVMWWLGAAALALGVVTMIPEFKQAPFDALGYWRAIRPLLSSSIVTAACWAVVYVLCGCFWKPPRLHANQ